MSARSNTISAILRKGESTMVEFKESFSRESLETLSAFTNTRGGKLFVGVDDVGKDIANQIDQGTGLQPSLKTVHIGAKNIILIEVSESKIKPRATWSEISPSKVKAFVRLANDVGRRTISEKIPTRQLLEKLDLVHKGKLTRAAILLFGKSPQKFYRQAIIKCGRFKSETLIVDDRETVP